MKPEQNADYKDISLINSNLKHHRFIGMYIGRGYFQPCFRAFPFRLFLKPQHIHIPDNTVEFRQTGCILLSKRFDRDMAVLRILQACGIQAVSL